MSRMSLATAGQSALARVRRGVLALLGLSLQSRLEFLPLPVLPHFPLVPQPQ